MKILKMLSRFFINHFLSCTHFWGLKRFFLRCAGVKVGAGTKVVGPIYFCNKSRISFGKNCWIGKDFSIDGDGICEIGDYVDIAPHCVINTGGHVIGKSTHRAGEGLVNKIVVSSGCWLGTNVTIVNNTEIGKGVVVAAGSVVIHSTEDNVLIAGVPAIIRRRLDE